MTSLPQSSINSLPTLPSYSQTISQNFQEIFPPYTCPAPISSQYSFSALTDLRDIEELKEKEYYDDSLQAYVQGGTTPQFGTKVVTGVPNVREREKIDRFGKLFWSPFKGKTPQEVIEEVGKEREARAQFENVTKFIKDKQDTYNIKIKDLMEEIKELEEGNVKSEYWTGSEKDYKKYEKLIEGANKATEDINLQIQEIGKMPNVKASKEGYTYEEPTVQLNTLIGYIGDKKIPVSTFTGKDEKSMEFQARAEAFNLFSQKVGENIGKVAGDQTELTLNLFGVEGIKSPTYYGDHLGYIIKNPSRIKDYFPRKEIPDEFSHVLVGKPEGKELSLAESLRDEHYFTKQEIVSGVQKAGTTAWEFGKYTIPIAGNIFFATEIEKATRPFDYNVATFVKEKPIEAAVLGASLLFFGGRKLKRSYDKLFRTPYTIQQGAATKVTNLQREIFGRKIIISKSGITTKSSGGILNVKRKPIGLSESQLGTDLPKMKILSLSDEPTYKLMGTYITPLKDTISYAKLFSGGSRATATMPTKAKIRFDKKGVHYIKSSDEIVLSGLNPLTKAGKLERSRLFEKLSKYKIDPKPIKTLIATEFPKVKKIGSQITGYSFQSGESSPVLSLTERGKIVSAREPFITKEGIFYSRKSKPIEFFKDVELHSTGKSLKTGESIYSGILTTTYPTKGIKFQTEISGIATVAQKTGTTTLPVPKSKGSSLVVGKSGKIYPAAEFDIYQSMVLSQKLPYGRKISGDIGTIYQMQPTQREVIELNKVFGIDYSGVQVYKGGGKQSSQKYFQKLYSTKEIERVGLEVLKKSPPSGLKSIPMKEPLKSSIKSIGTTTSPVESVWAGTGMYERSVSGGALGFSISKQEIQADELTPITESSLFQSRIMGGSKIGDAFAEGVGSRFRYQPSIKLHSSLTPKPISKTHSEFSSKLDEVLKAKQFSQLKEKQKSQQKEKQLLEQKDQLLIRQPFSTLQKTGSKLTTSPTNPFSSKFKLLLKRFSSKGVEKDEDEDGLFETFVKKKGKDISIGKFKTPREAKKALKTELLDTLRASGFIERAGEKVNVGLETFGSEFRKSKKEPYRIVQKASKRLGRVGETREIQMFKKSSGGKKWF
jgi:hypothetical protein